jgi:hypothetical protein
MACEALQGSQHRIALQAVPNALGAKQRKRIRFAQRKQAQNVIHVAIGQHHRCDRRMPLGQRIERGGALQLQQNIWRSIDQTNQSGCSVFRLGNVRARRKFNSYRILGSRSNSRATTAHKPTVAAATIPLGQAASSSRTEHR